MTDGNIKQFSAGEGGFRPSDIGMDAAARAGREIGVPYRETGDQAAKGAKEVGTIIDQHETMSDISQGAATLAVMTNNLHAQWNQTATDPKNLNDDTIQQKFLNDTLEPQLDQYTAGFRTEAGQKWATDRADSLRQHFYETTSADMSSHAGLAVKQSLVTQANNLAGVVQKNPNALPQAVDQMNATLDAALQNSNGRITPRLQEELQKAKDDQINNLVKGSIQGTADNGPNGPANALQVLNSGKFDDHLSLMERDELKRYTQTVSRENRMDQRFSQEQQEAARKVKANAAEADILDRFEAPQPNDKPISMKNDIRDNPDMNFEEKKTMYNVLSKDPDKLHDDPETFKNAVNGLRANTNNATSHDSLLNDLADGRMSLTTFRTLDAQVKAGSDEKKVVDQTMAEVKNNTLGPSTGVAFNAGAENAYTRFNAWFYPAYQQAKADPKFNGLSDMQKAQALLSKSSKDYMLTPEVMQQFKPNGDDLLPKQDFTKNAPVQSSVSKPPPPNDPARKSWVNSVLFGNK